MDIDILSGEHICACIRRNEKPQEKELPVLPHERRPNVFYERQTNVLGEEEVEIHLKALEIAEDWHKRQKQVLLDRIKELEAEVERLKKLTSQELVDKLATYEKVIEELKAQLTQLQQQNGQLVAQIEVKKGPGLKIRK